MSYEPVSNRDLATVVTFLEMHQAPAGEAGSPTPLRLQRLERPDLDDYRRLFRRVGARWLWFSRLVMNDAALKAIIHDPSVEIYAVLDESDGEAGMLELDFRQPGECELSFVALVPELAGKGHGRWLLSEAFRLAWREGIERVHVHTCSLDHPAALSAYRRAGFTAYRRAIERFPDPRLIGVLPLDCAPQVPLLGTLGSSKVSPDSCA